MNLTRQLGQRFALGFSGPAVTDDLIRLIRRYHVGNIILFRENLTGAEQARELCAELDARVREVTGHPALITIDQEGGMVSRLPDDMAVTPGQMAIAATGKPENAYAAAAITAQELLRIGVNMNLAPVVDVNVNAHNPVIGVRSYGDSADDVIRYAREAVRGYADWGVLCAAKHFPGHGDTHVDSHLALPEVAKPPNALRETELAPFAAMIRAGIPAIMTTHILFPALEPEELPATMSRRILTELLRGDMGFDGLILSDAMEMAAIKAHFGTPQGCVRALHAGVDIVFVCHDAAMMEESIEAALAAAKDGRIDAAECSASSARVLAAKEKAAEAVRRAQGRIGSVEARRAECARLMRETITRVPDSAAAPRLHPASGEAPLPALGNGPLVVGCLAYRSTIASTKPDSGLDFAGWMADALGGRAVKTQVNPDQEAIAMAVQAVQGATSIVIGTYNGHLNHGQIEMANALAARGRALGIPVIAVALRNPYDLALLAGFDAKLAAYEYTQSSFEALRGALTGVFAPSGRLPVALV